MRILFTTQSSGAEGFFNIGKSLLQKFGSDVESFMMVGSDQKWHSKYQQINPEIKNIPFLSEWAIAEKAKKTKIDLKLLRYFEDRYGQTLWRAALCDRRLMLGAKSNFTQDYRPRCSEDEILRRLQTAAVEVEEFFNHYKPSHVVGFICVTYLEFIVIQEAYARKIPVLNLRPVRIKDYFSFDSSLYDPPEELERHFFDKNFQPSKQSFFEANEFMQGLQQKTMLYEGVVELNRIPLNVRLGQFFSRLMNNIHPKTMIKKGQTLLSSLKYSGTHNGSEIEHLKYRLFKKWYYEPLLKAKLASKLIKKNQLGDDPFAFFPLHLEPEIALLLYAPAYQNQIEVVRATAQALPAGMKLYVKDHPVGYPRRSFGYYKKLLDIPNVRLVDPYLKSKELIEKSALVVTIGGSIGLEALCRKKPLIFLGPSVNYQVLSGGGMATYVQNLNLLEHAIFQMLRNYTYDEKLLMRFLATAIETSHSANFYSVILNRKDAYQIRSCAYEEEIFKIAATIFNKLNKLNKLGTPYLGNLARRERSDSHRMNFPIHTF